MTANILPNARTIFIDGNGTPLAAGSVFFYVPNTSTFKTTWQDSGTTIPNTNPVILDASGTALIFGSGQYRQVVEDSLGNTIWDNITIDPGYAIITSFSGTSTTSVAIGTGAKTFTTQPGLVFSTGQVLTISSNANALNYMTGNVTSYNITTGVLIMSITAVGGSGTHADWNISIGGPVIPPVNSVTNAILAQMPANTVKVNNTASLANPVDLPLTPGQILGVNSAGLIAGLTANFYQNSPANPTGATTTTRIMMGLAGAFTPRSSGVVHFQINANGSNTSTGGFVLFFRYGTGAAPANGAAETGTAICAQPVVIGASVANFLYNFTTGGAVGSLTPGTTYWFDVALANNGVGIANLGNINLTAFEIK